MSNVERLTGRRRRKPLLPAFTRGWRPMLVNVLLGLWNCGPYILPRPEDTSAEARRARLELKAKVERAARSRL